MSTRIAVEEARGGQVTLSAAGAGRTRLTVYGRAQTPACPQPPENWIDVELELGPRDLAHLATQLLARLPRELAAATLATFALEQLATLEEPLA